jgi:hypothetical protein
VLFRSGEGFGKTYIREVPNEDVGVGRREKRIRTVVGGQRVTVIVRDTIVPEDPYLNLVRAAAFPYQMGGGAGAKFPVPPVDKDIKDALIKTSMTI